MAASAASVKALNDKITELSSNLGVNNIVQTGNLTDSSTSQQTITLNQNVKNGLLIIGWFSTGTPADLSSINISSGTLELLGKYNNLRNRIFIYKITANANTTIKLTPTNDNFGAPYFLILD